MRYLCVLLRRSPDRAKVHDTIPDQLMSSKPRPGLTVFVAGGALCLAAYSLPLDAQTPPSPFPDQIEPTRDVAMVGFQEFAVLPDVEGEPARPMNLVPEPGTDGMFVNDMRGPIYRVSANGRVSLYLNVDDDRWGIPVEASGRERGMQSFTLHPQFRTPGTPGYGKLYVWTDTEDTSPVPDFVPGGGNDSHDTVLLEFTALDPSAPTYDGGAPRQLLRLEQPFGNHNGGHIAFNPTARPGDLDYGNLYVGVADGGSGGDPLDLSQNLGSAFGKIFRIHPTGSNARNGRYGIPADNPFARDGNPRTLGEIYASGARNPQRFGWDPTNGRMYMADIGQNIVEEVSEVTLGADLGWNTWEGSFRWISRQEVSTEDPRAEPWVTYPIAEWYQFDPLIPGGRSAATGVVVYRADRVPQLRNRILFGDFPRGEIFHVSADDVPTGGQRAIRRVLFRDGGDQKTLLQIVQEKRRAQGREAGERSDMRLNEGHGGRLFVLNKQDGVIREIVP